MKNITTITGIAGAACLFLCTGIENANQVLTLATAGILLLIPSFIRYGVMEK